jgi:RNA polymerase sigma-70 factor (ECF subfamily)
MINDHMPAMDNFDEAALIGRLKEGNKDAFIQLYNRYHRGLYAYVTRIVKLPDLAEDILQEVFLKIWDIRHRINPELSFQAYLYRISRNLSFKMLKRISADYNLRLRVMSELQSTVEDTALKASWDQYRIILKKAIDALPPRRQNIFKLCREEGKTYKEVAALLNISPYTVKEHMVLATKFIKEYLSRHGEILFYLAPPLFVLTGIV